MKPYSKIDNSVYDKVLLDTNNLSKNEIRVIFAIIRLTFGFNREKTIASARYISGWINNKNISTVNRAINKLIKKKILDFEYTYYNGKKTKVLFFNKEYLKSIGGMLSPKEEDFNISTSSAPAAAEGVCADISDTDTDSVSDTNNGTDNSSDSNAEKFDTLFREFFNRKRDGNIDFVEKKNKRLERWRRLLGVFEFDKLSSRLKSFENTRNEFYTKKASNKYSPALFELFCNQGIDTEKDKDNNKDKELYRNFVDLVIIK
jgi:phage replication O-like protein O